MTGPPALPCMLVRGLLQKPSFVLTTIHVQAVRKKWLGVYLGR